MKLVLLALPWVITYTFRLNLIGSKCLVLADNNPLEYYQTFEIQQRRIVGSHSSNNYILIIDLVDKRNANTLRLTVKISSIDDILY